MLAVLGIVWLWDRLEKVFEFYSRIFKSHFFLLFPNLVDRE
jgi:hypothetical protein